MNEFKPMQPLNQSEQLVKDILEGIGFEISAIDRSNDRTADFFMSDSRDRYLIEVKNREPAIDYRQHEWILDTIGEHTLIRRMDRSSAINGIVKDKAKQLRETNVESDFHVLWMTALHRDEEFVWESLMRTLYGLADLKAVRDARDFPDNVREVLCLYYDHFSFQNAADLDAVAFCSRQRVCLFVNSLSVSIERFRRCRLYMEFTKRGGLIDPELKSHENLLVLDRDVDRRDNKARWEALKRKYGLLTWKTTDTCFEMMARGPR